MAATVAAKGRFRGDRISKDSCSPLFGARVALTLRVIRRGGALLVPGPRPLFSSAVAVARGLTTAEISCPPPVQSGKSGGRRPWSWSVASGRALERGNVPSHAAVGCLLPWFPCVYTSNMCECDLGCVYFLKKKVRCKQKIFRHIKLAIHAWSTKCRWNQKLIVQLGCTLRDERFEPN
jgi:hypothetical protein